MKVSEPGWVGGRRLYGRFHVGSNFHHITGWPDVVGVNHSSVGLLPFPDCGSVRGERWTSTEAGWADVAEWFWFSSRPYCLFDRLIAAGEIRQRPCI